MNEANLELTSGTSCWGLILSAVYMCFLNYGFIVMSRPHNTLFIIDSQGNVVSFCQSHFSLVKFHDLPIVN